MRQIVVYAPSPEQLTSGNGGITPDVLGELLRRAHDWNVQLQVLVHPRDAQAYCRHAEHWVIGNRFRWPKSPVRLALRDQPRRKMFPPQEAHLWHLAWPDPRGLPASDRTPLILSLPASTSLPTRLAPRSSGSRSSGSRNSGPWNSGPWNSGPQDGLDDLIARTAMLTLPERSPVQGSRLGSPSAPFLGRPLHHVPHGESSDPGDVAGQFLQLYQDILDLRIPHQIFNTLPRRLAENTLAIHSSAPKLGLVLATFNRPELLRATLTSLCQTDLPSGTVMAIVDGGSSEQATRQLIWDFALDTVPVHKVFRPANHGFGVHESLRIGWDLLHERYGLNYFANIHSDVIFRHEWLVRSMDLYQRERPQHAGLLVTGFHTPRHPVKALYEDCYRKESCGGIHTLFDAELYHNVVRPNLAYSEQDEWGWDWRVVAELKRQGYPILCTRPSVIQHIGMFGQFSKGRHWLSRKRRWDTADDFIPDSTSLAGLAAYETAMQHKAA